MTEGVEIHYDSRSGELILTCGGTEFSELRDKVLSCTLNLDDIGATSDSIQRILIEVWPITRPKPTLREILNQIAWILMGFLFLVVCGAGIIKLHELFR